LLLLAEASPALAQTAPPQPTKPAAGVGSAQGPSKPASAGNPKGQTAAPKPQKPTQPAAQRAKPNTTYSYCRGVARYMRLRGAERRKTILDCQLGVTPSVSKG
jgi:hypothetical protein